MLRDRIGLTELVHRIIISWQWCKYDLKPYADRARELAPEIKIAFHFTISAKVSIVQGIINLNSPVITREARIVRKYEDEGMADDSGNRTHWGYYVVFEFSNGQRQRFKVGFWQYLQSKKGATGILHSQGSWYKKFDKI